MCGLFDDKECCTKSLVSKIQKKKVKLFPTLRIGVTACILERGITLIHSYSRMKRFVSILLGMFLEILVE